MSFSRRSAGVPGPIGESGGWKAFPFSASCSGVPKSWSLMKGAGFWISRRRGRYGRPFQPPEEPLLVARRRSAIDDDAPRPGRVAVLDPDRITVRRGQQFDAEHS
jgi:hypothetical protein